MRRRSTATMHMGLTAVELVAAARAGDTQAYATLFERYRLFAVRVARECSAPEVDDAVSEAFRRTISAIESGHGPTHAFLPYLATAVRTVVIEQRKIAARSKPVETDELERATMADELTDPMVAAAFATLPGHLQEAIWQVDVEGIPPREAATMNGLPSANAMSARLMRARAALRLAYINAVVGEAHTWEVRDYLSRLVSDGGSNEVTDAAATWHLERCDECRDVASRVAAAIPPSGTRMLAISMVTAMGFAFQPALLPAKLAVAPLAGAASTSGTSGNSGAGVSGTGVGGAAVASAVIAAGLLTAAAVGLAGMAFAVSGLTHRGNDEVATADSAAQNSNETPPSVAVSAPVVIESTVPTTVAPTTTPTSTSSSTSTSTSTTSSSTSTLAPTTTRPPSPTTVPRAVSPTTVPRPNTTTTTAAPPTTTTEPPPTTTTTTTTSTTTTTTQAPTRVGEMHGHWQNQVNELTFDLVVQGLSGESGTIRFSRPVTIDSVVGATCDSLGCTFSGLQAPDTVTVIARTDLGSLAIELLDSGGNVDDSAVIG